MAKLREWDGVPNAVAEGQREVGQFVPGHGNSFALGDTGDSSLFDLDPATGLLRFRDMPDFEAPRDGERDNFYVVEIIERDSEGQATPHLFVISVSDRPLIETGQTVLAPSTPHNDQENATIAALGNGYFAVAWEDESYAVDTSYLGIRARIFRQREDGSTVAVGDDFQVNSATFNSQFSPQITALSSDRFIISWTDYSFSGADTSLHSVRAKIFGLDIGGTASPLGDEFVVNGITEGSQWGGGFSSLGNGRFLATWQDGSGLTDPSYDGIKGQVFVLDAAGAVTKVSDEFLVNQTTLNAQFQPVVTSFTDRRFVVAWGDASGLGGDNSEQGIKARSFGLDASGHAVALSDEFLVNAVTKGSQLEPSMTALDNGRFVVTWASAAGMSNYDIKGQLFDLEADGSVDRVGDEFIVNNRLVDVQGLPNVVSLAGGYFAVSWSDVNAEFSRQGDGFGYSAATKGRLFFAGGEGTPVAVGNEFTVNNKTAYYQGDPAMALVSDHGLVIAYTDGSGQNGDASGFGIVLQNYLVDIPNPNAPVLSTIYGAYRESRTEQTINLNDSQTFLVKIGAIDADGDALTFTLTGTDAGLFTFDPATGEIHSKDILHVEDFGFFLPYSFNIEVTDGTYIDRIAVKGHLLESDFPIEIRRHVTVEENSLAMSVPIADNVESFETAAYRIVGGRDAALFLIDAQTGVLSFNTDAFFGYPPNFELPRDFDGDNVYEVTVEAVTDPIFDEETGDLVDWDEYAQDTVEIEVSDVNEAPYFPINTIAPIVYTAENDLYVVQRMAFDEDEVNGHRPAPAISIIGGADAALFRIDPNTGALYFIDAPDFENPSDANHDNRYTVILQADDGEFSTAQVIHVEVRDIDEMAGDGSTALDLAGPAITLNETTAGDQYAGQTAALSANLLLTAWTNSNMSTIGVRLLSRDSSGTHPVGAEITLEQEGLFLGEPRILAISDSKAIIGWYSYDELTQKNDYSVQAFEVSGGTLRALGEAAALGADLPAGRADFVKLSDDSFLIAYERNEQVPVQPGSADYYLYTDIAVASYRLKPDGSIEVLSAPTMLSDHSFRARSSAVAERIDDGHVLVTWQERDMLVGQIVGTRADGSLDLSAGIQTLETGGHRFAGQSIAMLSPGRFVMSWTEFPDYSQPDSGGAVRARLFQSDAAGVISAVGNIFAVDADVAGQQGIARIIAVDAGHFLIAYSLTPGAQAYQDNASSLYLPAIGISAQLFGTSGSGTPVAIGDPITLTREDLPNDFAAIDLVKLANGQFFIGWTGSGGNSSDLDGFGSRGQIFTLGGSGGGTDPGGDPGEEPGGEPPARETSIGITSASSGMEGSGTDSVASFVLTRGGDITGALVVDYHLTGDRGLNSDDVAGLLPRDGQVTFLPGETVKTISLTIEGDYRPEGDEQLVLTIDSATSSNGATVHYGTVVARAEILNDDEGARVSVSGSVVEEGMGGQTPLTFTLHRAGGLEDAVTLHYSLGGEGSNALNQADFVDGTQFSGTMEFAAGETEKQVTLQLKADTVPEADEAIRFVITSAESNLDRAVNIETGSAIGKVTNDDSQTAISVGSPLHRVLEGNGENEKYVEFVVYRTGDTSDYTTVDYRIDTTTLGSRFVPVTTTIVDRNGGAQTRFDGFQEVFNATTFPGDKVDVVNATRTVKSSLAFATNGEIDAADILFGPFGAGDVIRTDLFTLQINNAFNLSAVHPTAALLSALGLATLTADVDMSATLGAFLKAPSLGSALLSYPVETIAKLPVFAVEGDNFLIGKMGSSYTVQDHSLTGTGAVVTNAGLDFQFSLKPIVLSLESPVVDKTLLTVELPGMATDGPEKLFELDALSIDRDLLDVEGLKVSLSNPAEKTETKIGKVQAAGIFADISVSTFTPFAEIQLDLFQAISNIPGLEKLPWIKALKALHFKEEYGTEITPDGEKSILELEGTIFDIFLKGQLGLLETFTFHPTKISQIFVLDGAQKVSETDSSLQFQVPDGTVGSIKGKIQYQLEGDLTIDWRIAPGASIGFTALEFNADFEHLKLSQNFGPAFEPEYGTEFERLGISIKKETIHLGAEQIAPITQAFTIPVISLDQLYQAGSVTFAPGETQQVIRLPLIGDAVAEPNVEVSITLTNADNRNGSPVNVTIDETSVTVVDDDAIHIIRPFVRADPHLLTLDGLGYDFMAVGEFVLLRSVGGPSLEIQARTEPLAGSDLVSISSAIAIATADGRLTVDSTKPNALSIAGVERALAEGQTLKEAGFTVSRLGADYYIGTQAGDLIRITLGGGSLDFGMQLAAGREGKVAGLLGNHDGNIGNEFALADGTTLGASIDFDTLYGAFANSWRVTQASSLFDYAGGQGTADFQRYDFPRGAISLDSLPADAVAAATAIVDALGITDPLARKWAIFDVAVTGDANYAERVAAVKPATGTEAPLTEAVIADTPIVAALVGVTGLSRATEGDAGGTTALTYQLYRTGSTDAALTVNYSVAGDVDAADFGGSLPGGSVTFAVGEAMATINIILTGDTVAEGDEALRLRIALGNDASPSIALGAAQATTVIANDDGPSPTAFTMTDQDAGALVEGHGGSNERTFVILRTGNLSLANTLVFRIARSDEGLDGADFAGGALPETEVRFAAGETRKTVTFAIAGDNMVEADEHFAASLSGTTVYGAVAIEVHGVILNDDHAPVARADTLSVTAGAAVAANLFDENGHGVDSTQDIAGLKLVSVNGIPVEAGSFTSTSGAVVTFGSDGMLHYARGSGFRELGQGDVATESFTYVVADRFGRLADAVVSIAVSGLNDAPLTGGGQSASVQTGKSIVFDLLSGASDPDGDILDLVVPVRTSHGTLAMGEDGRVSYTSDAGYVGEDSFDFRVSDGLLASSKAQVTIVVTSPSSTPTDGDDIIIGTEISDRLEGLGGNDILTGGRGSDLFLFDNRGSTGHDRITDFGSTDLLLSRERIFDSNHDGVIRFGSNRELDLNFAFDSRVAITDASGRAVTRLVFEGVLNIGDIEYYAYGTPGSAGLAAYLDHAML